MKPLFGLLLSTLFIPLCSNSQHFTLRDTAFDVGDTLITHAIFFDLNETAFRPESLLFIDQLIMFLNQNKNLSIEIGVHFDERYPNEYSTCLSCKRAAYIGEYLIAKGIDSSRISSKGYDDLKPIIKGARREQEHQINRRIEIVITEIKQ